MAWVDVVMKCGCEGRVEVFCKRSDRDRRAQWIADRRDCDDCFKAAREATRKAAVDAASAAAAELDLPDLIGTPKQIDWAARIRGEMIETGALARVMMHKDDRDTFDHGLEILLSKPDARWWIESGRVHTRTIDTLKDAADAASSKQATKAPETVIRPKTTAISSIRLGSDVSSLTISTDRKESEDFIEAIRDIGFMWDSRVWKLAVPAAPVPMAHVAAGVALEIVALSYSVIVDQPEIAELIAADEVEPDNPRKVVLAAGRKHVLLRWRKSDDIYDTVKTLPGAKWDSPYMRVPLSAADEVLDLADRLGFFVALNAREALEGVEQLVVAGKTVELNGPRKVAMTQVKEGVSADLADH